MSRRIFSQAFACDLQLSRLLAPVAHHGGKFTGKFQFQLADWGHNRAHIRKQLYKLGAGEGLARAGVVMDPAVREERVGTSRFGSDERAS